jgi:ribosome-associated heat shock protein Hsp15
VNTLPLVDALRLDKWLWAARLMKTRALAVGEIERGRVRVNGTAAKPSRELRAGDQVEWRHDGTSRVLVVRALSTVRGPAPLAQQLYEETPESVLARQAAAQSRREAAEPAAAIEQGRPTKRDRRQIDQVKVQWRRWSASLDDEDGR